MTKAKILSIAYNSLKTRHIPENIRRLEGFDDLKDSIIKNDFTIFETYICICGSQLSLESKGKLQEKEAIKTIIDYLTNDSTISFELTRYIIKNRYQENYYG